MPKVRHRHQEKVQGSGPASLNWCKRREDLEAHFSSDNRFGIVETPQKLVHVVFEHGSPGFLFLISFRFRLARRQHAGSQGLWGVEELLGLALAFARREEDVGDDLEGRRELCLAAYGLGYFHIRIWFLGFIKLLEVSIEEFSTCSSVALLCGRIRGEGGQEDHRPSLVRYRGCVEVRKVGAVMQTILSNQIVRERE